MTPFPPTMLVVAKAPVPGLAKTRLATTLGDRRAADIAAAALLDTLDAVSDTPATARIVAVAGDLDAACRAASIYQRLSAFTVVEQRGVTFAERLANAHADAAAASGCEAVLQIGTDTPQVDAVLLTRCARMLVSSHAVLGPALDGGWWLLGVAHPEIAQCLLDVPMSQPDTGARTCAALKRTGGPVVLAESLGDVDTVADIPAVRAACRPSSRFASSTSDVSGM